MVSVHEQRRARAVRPQHLEQPAILRLGVGQAADALGQARAQDAEPAQPLHDLRRDFLLGVDRDRVDLLLAELSQVLDALVHLHVGGELRISREPVPQILAEVEALGEALVAKLIAQQLFGFGDAFFLIGDHYSILLVPAVMP